MITINDREDMKFTFSILNEQVQKNKNYCVLPSYNNKKYKFVIV